MALFPVMGHDLEDIPDSAIKSIQYDNVAT